MELNLGNSELLAKIKNKTKIAHQAPDETFCPFRSHNGDTQPCLGDQCVAYTEAILYDNEGLPTLHFWNCANLVNTVWRVFRKLLGHKEKEEEE